MSQTGRLPVGRAYRCQVGVSIIPGYVWTTYRHACARPEGVPLSDRAAPPCMRTVGGCTPSDRAAPPCGTVQDACHAGRAGPSARADGWAAAEAGPGCRGGRGCAEQARAAESDHRAIEAGAGKAASVDDGGSRGSMRVLERDRTGGYCREQEAIRLAHSCRKKSFQRRALRRVSQLPVCTASSLFFTPSKFACKNHPPC